MADEDDRCVEELATLFRATRELMDGTAGPIERLKISPPHHRCCRVAGGKRQPRLWTGEHGHR
jgi:hypothetical protein